MRASFRLVLSSAPVAAVAAVTLGAQNPRDLHRTGPESFATRVLASGLGNPWEITWGPDDQLWVTERTTFKVTRINPVDGSRKVALTLDDAFQAVDQDGLLGMALHPGLLKGRGTDFVYLAYVYDADPGPAVRRRLRIRRWTYDPRTATLRRPSRVRRDRRSRDHAERFERACRRAR